MSMEEQIMRLAFAVENLADAVRGGKQEENTVTPEVPVKKTRAKKAPEPEVPVATPPGDDFVPGEPEAPAVLPGIGLDDPTVADLRELAQKLAAAAGPKSDEFVAFLKKDICGKYCPKEMKLANVPARDVPEAIRAINDYAEKHSIGVGK